MASLGLQITAVQLRVGAGLLNDENLNAQLQQLVEGCRVEILSPTPAQRDRHTTPEPTFRPRPSTSVPCAHTCSNSRGSSDNFTPSEGTISVSRGRQDS